MIKKCTLCGFKEFTAVYFPVQWICEECANKEKLKVFK